MAWETKHHPLEKEIRNHAEQVKAPSLIETITESSESDMVTMGSSEVHMMMMGSEKQESFVNYISQSINGKLLGSKTDLIIDIEPDPSPPGASQGPHLSEIGEKSDDSSKQVHGLERDNWVEAEVDPLIEAKLVAQRKRRGKVSGGLGLGSKGKQKKRVWVRKIRSNEFGDKLEEAIPEKPPFKRKIGSSSKIDDV